MIKSTEGGHRPRTAKARKVLEGTPARCYTVAMADDR